MDSFLVLLTTILKENYLQSYHSLALQFLDVQRSSTMVDGTNTLTPLGLKFKRGRNELWKQRQEFCLKLKHLFFWQGRFVVAT